MLATSLRGPATLLRQLRVQPTRPLAVLAVAGLAIAYLRWAPPVPDLAAQVARTQVIRTAGVGSWWTGWFGGLTLPNYSVLVPFGMAIFGVRVIGLVAVALERRPRRS